MKTFFGLVVLICVVTVSMCAQQSGPNTEMRAIMNLRKVAGAESAYAMKHSDEGFACDAQVLSKTEAPNSATHAPLLPPELLSGKDGYKFSVQCDGTKAAGTVHIFGEPTEAAAGLPTFCATGHFHTVPIKGTSEFPIRKVTTGDKASCLASGKPLS
jgi:hypothetical protein